MKNKNLTQVIEELHKCQHRKNDLKAAERTVENILYRIYDDSAYTTALAVLAEMAPADVEKLDTAMLKTYKKVIAIRKKLSKFYAELAPECEAIAAEYKQSKLEIATLVYQNPYNPFSPTNPRELHRIRPLSDPFEGCSNAKYINKGDF